MPHTVLLIVMNNLEFQSIMILRKVCRQLRDFIVDKTPRVSIPEVTIVMNSTRFLLQFSDSNALLTEIEYKHEKNGCSVEKISDESSKEKLLKNQHFSDCFWRDFQFILKHLKAPLGNFCVAFEHYQSEFRKSEMTTSDELFSIIAQNFKNFFGSKNVQVRNIEFRVSDPQDILSILPIIDSKSLDIIKIDKESGYPYDVLKLDEIVEYQQWKMAKEVEIRHYVVLPMEHFFHFSKVEINIGRLTSDVLFNVKETFIRSKTLKSFMLNHVFSFNVAQVKKIFGNTNYKRSEDEVNWFIAGNDQEIIMVSTDYFSSISFKKIQMAEVPSDVIF